MELTYENVSAWFDQYFKEVVANIGPLETVPKNGKFFTDDFTYAYHTVPATAEFTRGLASREQLLSQMVHPGLREIIKPKYYAINLKEMICVVRFEDNMVADSGELVAQPFQASAHYTFVPAADTGIKIKLLEYWTSNQTPENIAKTQAAWFKYSKDAFKGIVFDWLRARY
jgi:hypothetical protein